jgi:hypothetical protein
MAFAAYSMVDSRCQVKNESYLSLFRFDEDFRTHLESTGSTRNFVGACWAPFIWFDVDRENRLDLALADARRLGAYVLERYASLDEDDVLMFYSGSKGFHVGVPSWVTGEGEGSVQFHQTCRHFASALADKAGIAIDEGIYDRVRPFRAVNSRHPRTGRHKRLLSFDELMGLSLPGIIDLASEPNPFTLPREGRSDPVAIADWQAAAGAVKKQQDNKQVALGDAHLNRLTLQFIRDGAQPGDRHRLLFSAAANLGEFGCPAELAHALLTEAGLDSGLPPREVYRQINCGLVHGRKHG